MRDLHWYALIVFGLVLLGFVWGVDVTASIQWKLEGTIGGVADVLTALVTGGLLIAAVYGVNEYKRQHKYKMSMDAIRDLYRAYKVSDIRQIDKKVKAIFITTSAAAIPDNDIEISVKAIDRLNMEVEDGSKAIANFLSGIAGYPEVCIESPGLHNANEDIITQLKKLAEVMDSCYWILGLWNSARSKGLSENGVNSFITALAKNHTSEENPEGKTSELLRISTQLCSKVDKIISQSELTLRRKGS